MKKSEIIKYLTEKKCEVSSYYRDGNSLNVYLQYLSGLTLMALNEQGLLTFIEAVEKNMLFLEISGDIEWD